MNNIKLTDFPIQGNRHVVSRQRMPGALVHLRPGEARCLLVARRYRFAARRSAGLKHHAVDAALMALQRHYQTANAAANDGGAGVP